MTFWIIITLLALLVTSVLALALLKSRSRDENVAAAGYDIQVYRDQLKSMDRDLARGVISEEDSARIKTEVSRRILDADKDAQKTKAGQSAPIAVTYGAVAVVLIALLGSVWVYNTIGAPGYPDRPLQARLDNAAENRLNRPTQKVAEERLPARVIDADPEHAALVAKLREALETRPEDVQGHVLLAGNEARLGNYNAAYRTQIKVIGLKGDAVTAVDYSALADMMILAADGYVSPQAETVLKRALDIDPKDGTARYYSGLMFAQTGRPDVAFRLWRDLLDDSEPNDPWVDAVRAQIEDASIFAGIEYQLPPLEAVAPLAGPTSDDIAAASEMSDEDRMEMVRSMVSRLSERLAAEGGNAQEWGRLIGALGVLGDTGKAAEIWAEAQEVFVDDADALASIHASAVRAGVAE